MKNITFENKSKHLEQDDQNQPEDDRGADRPKPAARNRAHGSCTVFDSSRDPQRRTTRKTGARSGPIRRVTDGRAAYLAALRAHLFPA